MRRAGRKAPTHSVGCVVGDGAGAGADSSLLPAGVRQELDPEIDGGSATFGEPEIDGGSATFGEPEIDGGSATFGEPEIDGGSATFG